MGCAGLVNTRLCGGGPCRDPTLGQAQRCLGIDVSVIVRQAVRRRAHAPRDQVADRGDPLDLPLRIVDEGAPLRRGMRVGGAEQDALGRRCWLGTGSGGVGAVERRDPTTDACGKRCERGEGQANGAGHEAILAVLDARRVGRQVAAGSCTSAARRCR